MPFGVPALPSIPAGIMHPMYELRTAGGIDQSAGGQFRPLKPGGKKIRFSGIVMPLTDEDLQYAEGGTFGLNSEKIYTNGHALSIGGQVYDPVTDMTYTVKQALGHNAIHPMKRYIVEAKGRSAAKM